MSRSPRTSCLFIAGAEGARRWARVGCSPRPTMPASRWTAAKARARSVSSASTDPDLLGGATAADGHAATVISWTGSGRWRALVAS